MKQLDAIFGEWCERKQARGPVHARQSEMKAAYNGDLVLAVPELRADEKPAVANLIQSTIDQTARRVASVLPANKFPPRRAGKAEEARAAKKGHIVDGWHHDAKMPRKLGRRSRWLLAYGEAPVAVVPALDKDRQPYPKWLVFDPLDTYPAPAADQDEFVPPDCIFSYHRSVRSLEVDYPHALNRLGRFEHTTKLRILEYIDADERVLMVVGDEPPAYRAGYLDQETGWRSGERYVELYRVVNLAGRPLVVIPSRTTLNRTLGQYDGMIGLYQMQAELQALQIHAVRRGVFAETWVYGTDPNRAPKIVKHANPYTGQAGEIRNGQIVQFNPAPGAYGSQMVDRLQGESRIDGSAPAEFGGLSATNIRTGRRGAQVMGATIDFIVQEAQQTFEHSLVEENQIAMAIMRAAAPSRSISMYSPKVGEITYTPDIDLDSDVHEVSYSFAGADAENLSIAGLQRVGAETLSHESFMEIDPFVKNVEQERDRITVEKLETGFLAGLQQQFADPQSPFTPAQQARILTLVKSNRMSAHDAVTTVQEEAQAAQAAAAQGEMSPEEMAPGLAPAGAPGTLDPEQTATIQGPTPGSENLTDVLANLRLSGMRAPGEGAVMR